MARGNLHLRNVILFGGQAAFLAAMLTMFPRNVAVPDLRPPLQRPDLALAMNAGNLLSLRQIDAGARPDPDFWSETAYGNRGIFLSRRTINGYTPTLLKELAAALCFDYTSAACPQASDKLFEQDRLTGLPLIDLLRVDRVTADAAHRESFARLAEGTWRAAATHQAQSIFERVKDLSAQPGSVTWSDGAAKLVLVERTPAEELYEIAVGSKDARVLFARASYQGFSAELDGRPLALTAHRGILPLVTIPAGSSGTLALRYVPPGLTAGAIAAAAAILALLLLGFLLPWQTEHRRRRAPSMGNRSPQSAH